MTTETQRIAAAVDAIEGAFASLMEQTEAGPFLRQAIEDFVSEGRDHLELIRTLCRMDGPDRDRDPDRLRKTG